MLDLSSLEEKPSTPVLSGKPLEIPLVDIEEDPEQPRKEFSEIAMEEMKLSILACSVKTPISVRSHPTKVGKWILNYGARRYRGSIAAGKKTIPAFIDESHNEYDQVIENIQREDLKPMELALFIKKRLEAGDKKNEIAKRLGKSNPIITWLSALIDAPNFLEELYHSGKCTSAQSIYELRALHDKYPGEVKEWCLTVEEISRKAILNLADELSGKNKVDNLESIVEREIDSEIENIVNSFEKEAGESDESEAESIPVKALPCHNPLIENGLNNEPVINDLGKIKKPLLLIEFDGRAAMVLLNRRPSSPGLLRIKYEDGSGEDEVDASKCKINYLTDSQK